LPVARALFAQQLVEAELLIDFDRSFLGNRTLLCGNRITPAAAFAP
jgi:hypothetical protein